MEDALSGKCWLQAHGLVAGDGPWGPRTEWTVGGARLAALAVRFGSCRAGELPGETL